MEILACKKGDFSISVKNYVKGKQDEKNVSFIMCVVSGIMGCWL